MHGLLIYIISGSLFLLQVGQDVVGELTKAMKKQGLEMRVSALVSEKL